ncbi:TPA: fimbrial protein [Photobacterium damselae]
MMKFYFRYIFLNLVIFYSSITCAYNNQIARHIELTGIVVSSTCSIIIEHDSKVGTVDLGSYNKATHQGGGEQTFWIKLYERGALQPGCSAFRAGSSGIVSLTFGDKSIQQLDSRGVVTRGAGGDIRLNVSSVDSNEVSSNAPLTSTHHVLTYPVTFATAGKFGFRVKPIGLERATEGDYHGELSLVISYK